MITSVHHTSFTVKDMKRSIAFYRDILAMKVLYDSVLEGIEYKGPIADQVTGCPGTEQHVVFMGIGESFLELVQYIPPGKPLVGNRASDVGSAHICFKTEDIDGLYQKLLKNNVTVHCSPQKVGVALLIYFRDPDGIILEAIEGKTRV